jgi:cis-3-alkyl-4-acyloxetan-2-one decarboxylase
VIRTERPAWLQSELPPGSTRSVYTVGPHQMSIIEQGAGFPVLRVHGNPTWSFLWRKLMSVHSGAPLRLLAPDLVGFGLWSKPGAQAHTIQNHSPWLPEGLVQLGLERCILVGQDRGGPIGLRAMIRRPERLAGLALLNAVLGPPRPGFKTTAFHRLPRLPLVTTATFHGLGFPQRALQLAQDNKRSITGDVARAYRYSLRGLRNTAAPLALARMVPNARTHHCIAPLQACQSLVERFSGPPATVWGTRFPILDKLQRHTQRMPPNAPVTETAAGHCLQEEVPAEIAAAILDVNSRRETL